MTPAAAVYAGGEQPGRDQCRLAKRLAGVPGVEVRADEPLSRYTSFKLGGTADWFVVPSTVAGLCQVLRIAWEEGCPVTVMGGGSNLLVADEGVRGIVIRMSRRLGHVSWKGSRVEAQAGASLPALAKQAAQRRLSGLEFAAGIPGTVGGAIVMNAGAHDGNMGRLVRQVQAVSRWGELHTFSPAECRFRYRGSRFLDENDWIVVSAELELEPGDPALIEAKMRGYLEARRRSQPLDTRNAGSVFKNPPGDYAGRLIDQAGCKGWREGGPEVSRVHANFIVNRGEASAADVWRLIQRVRRRVKECFGVDLELEIGLLGFSDAEGEIEVRRA